MDIQLHDKTFAPFIAAKEIEQAVFKIAQKIQQDFSDSTPLFLGVLNGSFLFCADLLKQYQFPCEISFVKLASYQKTSSTGVVNELIGLNEDLTNRSVIILEDIVDTGTTLEKIISIIKEKSVKEYKVASLFLKPSVYKKSIPIAYVGMQIPNKFIVGYGLDYNGLGRNIPQVYALKEN